MAARTTEEEVQSVVEVDSDIDLLLFIDAASILVDKIAECAIERDHTLSDSQLRHIETYLAAHFYTGRDPRYKSKQTERARASYFGKDDQYLDMAKLLDTSGCLDQLGREQHYMEFAWIGKVPSEQIDYSDRD